MNFKKEKSVGNLQIKNQSIVTPGCLVYVRGGIVPHLMNDILTNLHLNDIWHLPLDTIYEQPGLEVMQHFGKSYHEFSSLKDKVMFLNSQDSLLQKPTETYHYNEEKSTSIWTSGGRRKVTPEDYMKYLEVFQFDVCIPPSDCIPPNLSKKRCRKSVDRTLRFLDACLKIKVERSINTPVLGVIEGGDSKEDRERCTIEIVKKDVEGKIVDGEQYSSFENL